MTKKERAEKIGERLRDAYPGEECSLDYENAWQLLVAVRLAAQCTDARVNVVTGELFQVYPSVKALAAAAPEDIERIVRPCGLGRSKARDIHLAMNMLKDHYDGKVPGSMEELLAIPGVGRKSANLILGDVFGKPAVVTDTHAIRLTNRFGLTDSVNPVSVEKQLKKILDPAGSNDFCHRLVHHGRAVCTARAPKCGECFLSGLCLYGIKALNSEPIPV